MPRMVLSLLASCALSPALTPAPDGPIQPPPEPTRDAEAPTAPPLPERTSRPVPDAHLVLYKLGDMLERINERHAAGREEELLTRLTGSYTFQTELNIAPDAHTPCITGIATCEPILEGRGVRLSLAGSVAVGAANFPYASEGMLLYDADAQEYVSYHRDVLAGTIIEMRGVMNDDATELILTAAGASGDQRQAIAFSSDGITRIRNDLRPLGMEDFALRGLTAFAPIEAPPEPERFLVTYTPAWGSPDADGVYPEPPETQRLVYARHLRHLRHMANTGLLDHSGTLSPGEHVLLMRAPLTLLAAWGIERWLLAALALRLRRTRRGP